MELGTAAIVRERAIGVAIVNWRSEVVGRPLVKMEACVFNSLAAFCVNVPVATPECDVGVLYQW